MQTFNDILGYAQYETQREGFIVVDLTISAQESKAFNLSSLLRREREGQIGSWPTAQA
jgi:hypothetical protein